MPPAAQLEDVQIARIALVRRPANQRSLLLLKSEDAMPTADDKKIELSCAESMIPVLKSLLEAVKDEDAKLAQVVAVAKALDEAGQNKVRRKSVV